MMKSDHILNCRTAGSVISIGAGRSVLSMVILTVSPLAKTKVGTLIVKTTDRTAANNFIQPPISKLHHSSAAEANVGIASRAPLRSSQSVPRLRLAFDAVDVAWCSLRSAPSRMDTKYRPYSTPVALRLRSVKRLPDAAWSEQVCGD